ncbi:MAG: hypothetical protein ACTTJB_13270 [Bacteroides heparinolyticus]
MRQAASNIRSKQRRIYETSGLEYTKQAARNMRALTTPRQALDEDAEKKDNPFIINQINDYECKV